MPNCFPSMPDPVILVLCFPPLDPSGVSPLPGTACPTSPPPCWAVRAAQSGCHSVPFHKSECPPAHTTRPHLLCTTFPRRTTYMTQSHLWGARPSHHQLCSPEPCAMGGHPGSQCSQHGGIFMYRIQIFYCVLPLF